MTGSNIIFKILTGLFPIHKSEENKRSVSEANAIKITGEAYKKLNLYSRIVSEIAGKDIECGGIMLNHRDKNDGVIRDAYLDYQIVKSDRVWYLNDENAYVDYVQRLKMSWAGMWHSHGSYPPSHSGLDDKQIKKLHTYNKVTKACVIKNNQYTVSKKIARGSEVFYTPSVVINRDEYLNEGLCKNYYAEFLIGNGKGRDVKVKDAKIEIIGENNNIMPTLEDIVLEVGEKVKYKKLVLGRVMLGKKLKRFPKYLNILEKYKKLQINPEVQAYQKNRGGEYSYRINPPKETIFSKKFLDCINQGGKK